MSTSSSGWWGRFVEKVRLKQPKQKVIINNVSSLLHEHNPVVLETISELRGISREDRVLEGVGTVPPKACSHELTLSTGDKGEPFRRTYTPPQELATTIALQLVFAYIALAFGRRRLKTHWLVEHYATTIHGVLLQSEFRVTACCLRNGISVEGERGERKISVDSVVVCQSGRQVAEVRNIVFREFSDEILAQTISADPSS